MRPETTLTQWATACDGYAPTRPKYIIGIPYSCGACPFRYIRSGLKYTNLNMCRAQRSDYGERFSGRKTREKILS
jgi:hypothetical protein